MIPDRGTPDNILATEYKSKLLMKVSEQASLMICVRSQKEWGISRSVQKDSFNNIKVCSSAITMLMDEEKKVSRMQNCVLIMDMYLSGWQMAT
jgi:hypothetical protein